MKAIGAASPLQLFKILGTMNQRWRFLALWLLPIAVALFLGWQVLGPGAKPNAATNPVVAPRNAAVARMSYGRFLDYVQAGRVTAVDSFEAAARVIERWIPTSTTGFNGCGSTCRAWPLSW